jgi:parallel beta-helix repeat protein
MSFAKDITIENSEIHDTRSNGVDVYSSERIYIKNNRIRSTSAGIYIQDGSAITVTQNVFRNALGPIPRGQFVQFNRVNGPNSLISCNVVEHIPGESSPTESISMFDSNGTSSSPIIIEGNKVKGGYWGGVLLGDGGGSYQTARDNILVDSGMHGVGIAGGHNMQALRNKVYARPQSFTNVGLYVWNQYGPACYGHTVQGNTVDYSSSNSQRSSFWTNGNCGAISGLSSNNLNATLSDQIFDETPAMCTPSAPTSGGQQYLSDLPFTTVTNSWGPIEKDMSNGETAPRDGRTLSIRGVTYSKGLGVHASSELRYTMGARCTAFTATVGIDDEVRGLGSIVFQVWSDGSKLYDSGIVTGSMAAKGVNVNVSGRNELRLVVTNAGDHIHSDHADWANARLSCQ